MNHKSIIIGIVLIAIIATSVYIVGFSGLFNFAGPEIINDGEIIETNVMNSDGTYNVTFSNSGLDKTASSTVVTVTVSGGSKNETYVNLPYTIAVQSGTTIHCSYQTTVTTCVENCQFHLSNSTFNNFAKNITKMTAIAPIYGRQVIDYWNNTINIPYASNITKIADSWPAHNTVIVMLGAKEKLVATTSTVQTIAMFQRIFPGITSIPNFVTNNLANTETLLSVGPDVIFTSDKDQGTAIENAGMIAIRVNHVTFDEMIRCVRLTGWVLGESALAKADAYVAYFNSALTNVTSVTSTIPTDQKLSVYHVSGSSPLYCDGVGTLIDTWISISGGTNAVTNSGNMKLATMEQVIAWNPDVILIGSANATNIKAEIMSSAAWSDIDAVKNNKVIVNPMGVFDWARYSVEEALNIQWVSQTLYPDKFNVDMAAQTKYFYQTFYGYTLSDAEVTAILNNTALP